MQTKSNKKKKFIFNNSNNNLAFKQVLFKTYLTLSLHLFFSASVAFATIVNFLPHPGAAATLISIFILMLLSQLLRNNGYSKWSLVVTFAIAGFIGYTLVALLTLCSYAFYNTGALVMIACGEIGIVFFMLSFYHLIVSKKYNYIAHLLFATIINTLLALSANMFLKMSPLLILIFFIFVLMVSYFILLQITRNISHNKEQDYVMVVIALYVSLFTLVINFCSYLWKFILRITKSYNIS